VGCYWRAAVCRYRTCCWEFGGFDDGVQESQGRRAGKEPVQGRWHQRDRSEGRSQSIGGAIVLCQLKMRKVAAPKADKGLGGRLRFAGGSFDLATSPNRQIHDTTNCPRKPRNTSLHTSKWQGTSTLELWPWLCAPESTATASHTPPPFRMELDTDSRQLGYAREQSALLATRVPEARRTEDLGEGAYRIPKRRADRVHMTCSETSRRRMLDIWHRQMMEHRDKC
jgi:hypothetical protein